MLRFCTSTLCLLWLQLFPFYVANGQTSSAHYQNVPVIDWGPIGTVESYISDKKADITALTTQATAQSKTPAEIRGMANGTYVDANGITHYSISSRSYENGQGIPQIAFHMLGDWWKNIVDFYLGEAHWSINGLCKKKTKFWPYQKYRYPVMWGEINSDLLRGRYLDNLIVRPLFEQMLQSGPMLPFFSGGNLVTPSDAFDLADELAPLDINRTEALTMPHADGTPPTPLERASLYLPAIGSQGQIPDTPSAANGFHANPQALKRGEVNSSHRNLEFHQFSGMAQFTHFPKAFAGNCHQNITVELIPPFIHRSDNPALYPFSRSKTNNDLLLMLKGKANKVALATTPDVCLAYDLQGTRGLPGALGAWGSDPKFGTLSEINSSLIGALTLNGATPNNCMRSSGAVWDLTNRIRGNKPFQANFYTRFLRADKLTNLYSDNGFHSFHRWDGAGSRYPSRLQVVNSSFGTHGPKTVTESRYKDVWTDPSNYSNARFGGGNIDYARYVVWVGMNCCPKKYKVIWGPTPQIDGDEEFTGDAA